MVDRGNYPRLSARRVEGGQRCCRSPQAVRGETNQVESGEFENTGCMSESYTLQKNVGGGRVAHRKIRHSDFIHADEKLEERGKWFPI